MKAIIIGATGATGEFLVDQLLEDKDYTTVTIFVRRSIRKQHPKLVEQIVDFSNIESFKDLIVGDVFFLLFGNNFKSCRFRGKSEENRL